LNISARAGVQAQQKVGIIDRGEARRNTVEFFSHGSVPILRQAGYRRLGVQGFWFIAAGQRSLLVDEDGRYNFMLKSFPECFCARAERL
jgi:hypothetical protein